MRLSNLRLPVAIVLIAGSYQASAAGTTAGTDVNNTATVNYDVGGTPQAPANSNIETFKVDRRVNLVVAETGAADTTVVNGATAQATTFTVTNTTNGPLDFGLSALDTTGAGPHGGTDNYDVTNIRYFVDTNNDDVFSPGDTQVTFLDEVPADTSVTVFVVADIPANRVNGDLAVVQLTATAQEAGAGGAQGAVVTQTAGADTKGAVDTVFGDAAGVADAVRDGKSSDDDAYKVQTATITVAKSSTVIDDPLNGTNNPKRIPGATVEYCIAVSNDGGVTASNVIVSDALTGQPVAYVAGSGKFGAGDCAVTAGETSATDAADGADGYSFAANTVTSSSPGTVAANSKIHVRFRVTIN